MTESNQILEESRIKSRLTRSVASKISSLEIHDEIESTNSYLMTAASTGLPSGAVCIADSQTAGRGRLGRKWVSPAGNNIYLSLMWRFDQGPMAISGLSLAMGVAVIRALKKLGLVRIGLKWPNDILWQNRKLGGILVEVGGNAGGPCAAVLGLGLNTYLSNKEGSSINQAWIDLARIMDSGQPSRNELIALLLNELVPITISFEKSGLAPYLDEWRESDSFFGRRVVLSLGATKIYGIARGINAQGMINLEADDGKIKSFASGEVTLRTQ